MAWITKKKTCTKTRRICPDLVIGLYSALAPLPEFGRNYGACILKTSWRRKHRWLGYVLRHETYFHDIIEEHGEHGARTYNGVWFGAPCGVQGQSGGQGGSPPKVERLFASSQPK